VARYLACCRCGKEPTMALAGAAGPLPLVKARFDPKDCVRLKHSLIRPSNCCATSPAVGESAPIWEHELCGPCYNEVYDKKLPLVPLPSLVESPKNRGVEVTNDRRVQQLTEKLYGVDFGVNMDGWSRARIAQVIVAMVDVERQEVIADLKRIADWMPSDHTGVAMIKAVAIDSAADTLWNRYAMPDVPVGALWKAGQPNKDWVET